MLATTDIFLFEEFRLDRRGDGLSRRNERGVFVPVPIGLRALDVLSVLVERSGDLVSKEEIMAAVWRRTVVENANLTVQISALRRVLDEGRTDGSCIQTVAARGYRFVAPVTRVGPSLSPPAPQFSIVVLPFTNLSDDHRQRYLADGITDDLTTDLSRLVGITVTARNTAFTYRDRLIDAKLIGRELGVRYVIAGSLRQGDGLLRVNVQLTDAESGTHAWADRFDTDCATIAEAQSEFTGRLARTINLKLLEAARRRIEQETALEPDRHDLLIQAWAVFDRPISAAALQEAQRVFERVLEIDPGSVAAKIGVAYALSCNIACGWSTSVQRHQARAETLLLEAIERDANNATARQALGLLRRLQNRLAESHIELDTAIALASNNATAFYQLGMTLIFLGQPEAAIPKIEKGMRLDPHDTASPSAYSILSLAHLLLAHVDEAVELSRTACTRNPKLYFPHMTLAAGLGLKGELDEASAALADGIKRRPEFDSVKRLRAYTTWGNPRYKALREQTLDLGLLRAGMPHS